MPQLPFDIPKSLSSYVEHFEDDPIKAINRLEKQLKKRGPDAVGHFLLAWFYHLKGMDDQAVEEALKARIFAPGSPFFQKLHYYLSHPKAFEAWTPDTMVSAQHKSSQPVSEPSPVLNLDALIQKLSTVDSERIYPKEIKTIKESTDESKQETSTDNIDDIVSETLANIHEKQGKMDDAIRIYKQLKKLNQDKRDHYSDQIKRLQKLKEENNEE
jgi:tetratricopeptide (TPR) repeat protein